MSLYITDESGKLHKIAGAGKTPNMNDYYKKTETYSKSEVDEKIDNIETGESVDLTNYYTKDQTYSQKEVNDLISGIETGGGTGGESSMVVDSEFSETSENPVQNKVITKKFNSFVQSSKNLLKFTGTDKVQLSGVTFTRNNCEVSLSGYSSSTALITFDMYSPVELKAGKSYAFSISVISGSVSGASNREFHAGLRDSSGNSVVSGYDIDAGEVVRVITPSQDTNIFTLAMFTSESVTYTNYTVAVQLEEGTQKTYYEPHGARLLTKEDIHSWVSLANPLNVNTISSNYVAVDISSVVDQFVDGAEYEVMAMWGIDGASLTSGTIVMSMYTDLLGSGTGAITIFTDPATTSRRNVSIMPCKRYLYYKTSDVANTYGLYMRVYAYRRIK